MAQITRWRASRSGSCSEGHRRRLLRRLYSRKPRAQEAHEAIRPTLTRRDPDSIKQYLSLDQQRLYKLIWQRFIASQMANAVFDQTSVDIGAGKLEGKNSKGEEKRPFTFRAT